MLPVSCEVVRSARAIRRAYELSEVPERVLDLGNLGGPA